jgi:hypothetical protein
MSERGRNLFDRYVREMLRHPVLAGLGLQSHIHNLLADARDSKISRGEIEEEVGPLMQALSKQNTREQVGAPCPRGESIAR